MADPFLAEIRILPFTFVPKGWAWCNGQIMPISQNTALFALLGTFYGGDGKSTFAMPNLQGSVPIQQGAGPGLSDYFIGQVGGAPTVTLISSEIPAHTHILNTSDNVGERNNPANNYYAVPDSGNLYQNNSDNLTTMASAMISPAGESLPHNNMQPYLTVNFCIALQGIFPPRP